MTLQTSHAITQPLTHPTDLHGVL